MKMSKSVKLPRRSVTNVQAVDEPVELENHLILRLPAEAALQVRTWLEEGGAAFKDKLSIQFQPDMRHAQVKVEKEIFYGKLVDLPCVVETLKTLDKKTFYKVTDVAQMLVCKTEPDDADEEQQKQKDQRPQKNENQQAGKDPKKKDKQYQWPHGLTAPLKNVRKRRFRKTLKKKYMDAPELEKELKRLLREDMEAVRVKWDIITADQEVQQKSKTQKQKLQQEGDQEIALTADSSSAQATTGLSLSRVDELFGGALSSSSSSDDGASDPGSDIEQPVDSDVENDATVSSAAVFAHMPQRDPESMTNSVAAEDDDEAEGRELAQQLMM